MKVVCYKQDLNLIAGLRRHGITPIVRPNGPPTQCDLAIVWGYRKAHHMRLAKRTLVMERGYVGDRFYWTSMGFDGLNGYAKFYNENSPPDRWNKLFQQYMQPWRDFPYQGQYVLVLAQKPGDASLRGLDTVAWAYMMHAQGAAQHIDVRIRWHPKSGTHNYRRFHPKKQQIAIAGSLHEALVTARWAVTYNSNSAVDAVLAGVPTVTLDQGAMAYPVTGHNPFEPPPMPDRTQWAYNIAYTQWSPSEIANGDAIDHLKQGIMELA